MIPVKEVTMLTIANRLNISTATVCRALKNDPVVSIKTKKKTFAVADEMNHRTNHFASSLLNPRRATISAIVPRLKSNFISSAIAGIESIVNSEGYNLIISQSSEDVGKEIASQKAMFTNRVGGLLVSMAYNTRDLTHFNIFLKKIWKLGYPRLPVQSYYGQKLYCGHHHKKEDIIF